MNRRQILAAGGAALAACAPATSQTPPPAFPMRRGVNLGNGLEAPNEGEWGYRIELAHLAAIADAGFDGIRLPVRWDTHRAANAPYAIEPAFLARIDQVVMTALGRGLKVQLDAHHYAPMLDNPDAETPRFRALWREIAEHFSDAPEELYFEPLNEPQGEVWTGARVTAMQTAALEEIRATNPTRLVVLGGPNWNSIDGLSDWTPPVDAHSVATAHYYEPFAFTHQGASWSDPPPVYEGQWGSAPDRRTVEEHIGRAASWARAHGMAMQLGEFWRDRRR
ncbi:MAG: glycoside hydrolase family 5 protein [Terricaulis sp.]